MANSEKIDVAVDSVFGLGINFHDNDQTARQASVTWAAVLDDHIWDTPKMLGTVKFLENNRLQFIAKNNMTGKTNPAPYDGTPFYMRIDGLKDPFYYSLTNPTNGYLQIQSSAFSTNGPPKDNADLSAKVWAGWDAKWLYMYAEVKDDTISASVTAAQTYNNDGMELKIDPKATDSTNTGSSIFAPNFTALDGAHTATVGASDSLSIFKGAQKYFRKTVAGGYVLEFAVPWDSIMANSEKIDVAVDSVFGLGINFHDNDKTTRQASVTWAAFLDDHVWDTPKMLGTVKFKAANKLEFKSTNKMTGRTGHTQKYDGTDIPLSVERIDNTVPATFTLGQNYPNPFNPSTSIQFGLPARSNVRIMLFNILGQVVGELVSGEYEAGRHKVTFNASRLSSGVYFYRIEAGDFTDVKKMMLMK
jgi:hypothetical protein